MGKGGGEGSDPPSEVRDPSDGPVQLLDLVQLRTQPVYVHYHLRPRECGDTLLPFRAGPVLRVFVVLQLYSAEGRPSLPSQSPPLLFIVDSEWLVVLTVTRNGRSQ